MTQIPVSFALAGGLDLATPAMAMSPGSAIGGFNYEPDIKGYRRLTGYERMDGLPAPSDAAYAMIYFSSGSAAISAADTLTGATSGATGIVIVDATVTAGTVAGGDAVGYVALAAITGTFASGEALEVSSSDVATSTSVAVTGGAPSDAENTAWLLAERTRRRALIAKPAGEGPVRGVWSFDGFDYAVRDATGAASAVLFKSSATGWTAQNLGRTISFTDGTAAFVEGETLTQGGVTATVDRVILTSGNWGDNDAAGYLALSSVAGGAFTAATATTAGGSADLAGADTANVLPPGGTYQFLNHNFFGAKSLMRMYGANGVGRAFEWDGSVFTFIRAPVPSTFDTPRHVAEYGHHLWLSFDAGSWLFSGIGEPLDFRAIAGAGEIAVGDEPVGAVKSAGVLTLFAKGRVDYVTGTSAADFRMVPVSGDSGAVRHTAQLINTPIYMDTGAIRKLTATQALGGWRMGGLSGSVEKLIQLADARGDTPVASMRLRSLDLYRVFYSDGSGLSLYVGRKFPEIMPMDLPIIAHCAFSGLGPDGTDKAMIGGADGFVYHFDSGVDFDGANLTAMVRLAFFAAGTPRIYKKWHYAHVEVDGVSSNSLTATAEFSYGNPDQAPAQSQDFAVRGGGGFWDTSFWNAFNWSAQVVGTADVELNAIGFNISLAISTDAAGEAPHTLSVLTLDYSKRGRVKGNV
jgi:hypothetical protein